jgi:peptidoglycan hydrolase-like protein with peptidoglycan-binding domain|tara:strand:+ start:188 stop:1723 length:1536 start_codon:yes stop_codon:yes gene_type:complete
MDIIIKESQYKTIISETAIPSGTYRNMKNNVSSDFYTDYEVLDYCNFLEYWKTRYNKHYQHHLDNYTEDVQDAIAENKTQIIGSDILSTIAFLESGGKAKPTGNPNCFGLFQFCGKYFSSYGIKNRSEAETPSIATRQAAKHLEIKGNAVSSRIGVDVYQPENQYLLYLSWQQGTSGLVRIFNGCGGNEEPLEDTKISLKANIDSVLNRKEIIRKGDENRMVEFIQSLLVDKYQIYIGKYGIKANGVDGRFGNSTKKGVTEFQKQYNLTQDGIVGSCTLGTLITGEPEYCCLTGKCNEKKCEKHGNCKNKQYSKHKEKTTTTKPVDGCGTISKKLPRKFEVVPGGGNNFRTNQPSLGQLAYIFEKHPEIQTVVRMNAEEGTGVSISGEKDCVESSGRKFVWVNAHEGYRPDEGYVQSMNKVLPYLEEGNTLIHCTAGKDRTGFMVARYLKDMGYNGWSDEELYEYTVGFNSWERKDYICNGTAYKKYMEGFYTIGNWCGAKEERNSCRVCR